MYRICMHCLRPLDANAVIEAMPVGRRLAFDAARGRLWIVCRGCERWNLTPFEERWEAIEQCERAFRGTTVRVSTDHIGLARLPDGTELVRIGEPQRPEMAAWRYGDQFGRRRRRAVLLGAGAVAGVGAMGLGGAALGIGIAAAVPVLNILMSAALLRHAQQSMTVLPLPDGGRYMPFGMPRLISDTQLGWGIDIGYALQRSADDTRPVPSSVFRTGWNWSGEGKNEQGRLQLYGADAMSTLRWAMPRANLGGARGHVIADGVKLMEEAGGPSSYPVWAAAQVRAWAARSSYGDTGAVNVLPHAARLALEMAVNEESERQAMEGELAALERAWADAEEVAVIADSLLVPQNVMQRFAAIVQRAGGKRRGREGMI